jgi:Thioredoxin like C-terminal domain
MYELPVRLRRSGGARNARAIPNADRWTAAHGIDVDEQGNGAVAQQRLYQLIRQPSPIADRQFEIEFLGSGVEAFAFTFG